MRLEVQAIDFFVNILHVDQANMLKLSNISPDPRAIDAPIRARSACSARIRGAPLAPIARGSG